jgi:hypothetical protein
MEFFVETSEITPDKIAAYYSTNYLINSSYGVIILRIGEYSPQLKTIYSEAGCPCGVVITAFNPLGQSRDTATNLAAQLRLGEHLRALSPMVIEAEGADPTGAWPPEPSFFALCINQYTARLLGARYRQDAVVWVGEDAIPEILLLR